MAFISKLFSYAFVIIIYAFILNIIRMIYLDIKVMKRKKSALEGAKAYLKLINLRQELDFAVEESYAVEDDTVIGRDPSCDIRISDPFLSGRHARIFLKDDTYYIEDLNSTNSTFLNGEELSGDAVELFDGDKIGLGQLYFLFVLPAQAQGSDKS